MRYLFQYAKFTRKTATTHTRKLHNDFTAVCGTNGGVWRVEKGGIIVEQFYSLFAADQFSREELI